MSAVVTTTFDEAWPILQEGFNKLIDQVEGVQVQQFTSEEYMRYYTVVFNVCHPNPLGPETQRMYNQYNNTIQHYISAKVLPSLRGKEHEHLLQELSKRWNNHKITTRWLSRFFHYIDRYYTTKNHLPSTTESSHQAFYNLVYGEMNNQIRDAIILMIDRERGGEEIDQALVKEAVNIYVEIANGAQSFYEKDFEETMINATKKFYSEKASEWIMDESYDNYLLKVAEHELLKLHEERLEENKNEHEGTT